MWCALYLLARPQPSGFAQTGVQHADTATLVRQGAVHQLLVVMASEEPSTNGEHDAGDHVILDEAG